MTGATNALAGPEAGEEWGDAGAEYAEKAHWRWRLPATPKATWSNGWKP